MQFLKKNDFSQKENFTITSIFISITWIISVYFPNIDKVISIMGGLCAVTVSYLIPTICYVKLSEHSWTHPKNLGVLFFFGILILIGYSSVIIIVYLIVTEREISLVSRKKSSENFIVEFLWFLIGLHIQSD